MERRVISHFSHAAGQYSRRKGIVFQDFDPRVVDFLKSSATPDWSVLEVGGGNGYTLELIRGETGIDRLVNAEISYRAFKSQAIDCIQLVGSHAGFIPFRDGAFDCVLAKNLLHHLVGRTRKASRAKVREVMQEMLRVIRPGGYIIIIEQ